MTDSAPKRGRKPPRPPLEVEVRLEAWGARGAVRATHEGRPLLIDRGIPGELVRAAVDRRRRPWRGVVDQVIEADGERIDPSCAYYLQGCGGCQWQHIGYAAQVQWKRHGVDAELDRQGLQARVSDVHAMEIPWRYRHTAAIAIGWEAGFRPRGRRGIVEIHDCPIAHPAIGRLSDALNVALRANELPHYRGKVWLDCTVVSGTGGPGLQVVLQGIEGLTLEGHPELPEVAERISRLPGVVSVAFRHRSGEAIALVGHLFSSIDVDGQALNLPAGSFSQTNPAMLDRLIHRMHQELAPRSIRHAADVYGGSGTFALTLASYVESMTLVELDPVAVEAARQTAQDRNLSNVQCVSRHAERALPDMGGLDLVIVDPPRSGLGERVTDALILNAAPLILYVSCAPASMARDLAALVVGGYSIRTVEMFDFYPQTYHVECLAVLER